MYDNIEQNSAYPKPYWSNTSSNYIIRELVEKSDGMVKQELEELILGGVIEKPIHEEITYADIYNSKDNLWNFLFFTGYLKMVGQRFEQDTIYLKMQIPNAEVGCIYRNTIQEWFESKVEMVELFPLYEAIWNKKCEKIEEFLTEQLTESISYYDNAESFYHEYLLGVLKSLKGYNIISNKEAGKGRPDIVLSPFSPKKPAIIIEIKSVKKFVQMAAQCEAALIQIEEKKYDTELLEKGYQEIIKYGICFCGKTCMVKCKE